MQRCHGWLAWALAVLLAPGFAAAESAEYHAAEDPAHEGAFAFEAAALPSDDTRSLGMAVDAALERLPGDRRLQARAKQVEAFQSRSSALLAGTPALHLRGQTDRWQGDSGLRELEGGLELPLWWPGQRAEWRQSATGGRALLEAEQQARRWEVATEVWNRYFSVVFAELDVELTQQEIRLFQALRRSVRVRIDAGDAAPMEVLGVEEQLRARQAENQAAVSRLAEANFEWRLTTGWSVRPALRSEVPGSEPPAGGTHPWLVLAQARLFQQKSELRTRQAVGAGQPVLQLGARSERAGAESSTESLGVSISVPFGGAAHRGVELSELAIEVAAAEDEVRNMAREVRRQAHEAHHRLATARRLQALAVERDELAESERSLARNAYEIGEMSLADRLQVELRATAATRARREAELLAQEAEFRFSRFPGELQ